MKKLFKIEVLDIYTGDRKRYHIDENTRSPRAVLRKVASFPDYCAVTVQRFTDGGFSEYSYAPREILTAFQDIA